MLNFWLVMEECLKWYLLTPELSVLDFSGGFETCTKACSSKKWDAVKANEALVLLLPPTVFPLAASRLVELDIIGLWSLRLGFSFFDLFFLFLQPLILLTLTPMLWFCNAYAIVCAVRNRPWNVPPHHVLRSLLLCQVQLDLHFVTSELTFSGGVSLKFNLGTHFCASVTTWWCPIVEEGKCQREMKFGLLGGLFLNTTDD